MSDLHAKNIAMECLVRGLPDRPTATVIETSSRAPLPAIRLSNPWAPHAQTGVIYGIGFEIKCFIRHRLHVRPKDSILLTEDWRPLPGQAPCGKNEIHSIALTGGLREAAKFGRSAILFGALGWLAVEIWGDKGKSPVAECESAARALLVFGEHLSAREKMLIAAAAP